MIPFRAAGLLVLLLGTGCLENLNQAKYFDTLEISAPTLAQRVSRHRAAIEEAIEKDLVAKAPPGVIHVGLWGETWDLVRRVTDGEQLFMRGRIFHEQGAASTYYVAFTVSEDGAVSIRESNVYARREVAP
ncbi:MAG: hypothetical protein K0V04_40455 [Deltaproteobacteria bacterium]|nr:hypothetical protein [Deltaproteobacteria bacterium]